MIEQFVPRSSVFFHRGFLVFFSRRGVPCSPTKFTDYASLGSVLNHSLHNLSSTGTQQMAHAYSCEVAERDYSIASTQLELANARRQIKVLEVQRSSLADDMETARTEYEVLVAQLAEEQDSGDALKRELASMRKALHMAAKGLSGADAEIARLTERAAVAERRAQAAIEAGKEGTLTALAQAEERLAASTKREAALEQRIITEFETKQCLEETAARERLAAARASEDANKAAGEAAALRRELTEQRSAVHELQRLLAERDGAVAVLKAQLADAEEKHKSGDGGAESELRGRLHEVERRSGELARELGSKSAALQALERQLGERTAEAANERGLAERDRLRIIELEAELRAMRSRFSSGGSGPSTRCVEDVDGVAMTNKATTATKASRITRHAHESAAARGVADLDDGSGSPGSLFTEEAAKATVVNVLDHLSLSGYVSPLSKTALDGSVRRNPDSTVKAALGVDAAFDDAEQDVANVTLDGLKRGRPRTLADDLGEVVTAKPPNKQKTGVSIDNDAALDPAELAGEGDEKVLSPSGNSIENVSDDDDDDDDKMPKASFKSPTPVGVSNLRMPLANIQKTGAAGVKGGEKKKRRLLNQVAVGGSDSLHPSLLFGSGEEFHVSKLK